MLLLITLLIKYCSSNPIVTVGLDVLLNDLRLIANICKESAYKGNKLYWYPNTAYSMNAGFVRLHFPNLFTILSYQIMLREYCSVQVYELPDLG